MLRRLLDRRRQLVTSLAEQHTWPPSHGGAMGTAPAVLLLVSAPLDAPQDAPRDHMPATSGGTTGGPSREYFGGAAAGLVSYAHWLAPVNNTVGIQKNLLP